MTSLQAQPEEKLKKIVIDHTVRTSVMKALNISSDQYEKVKGNPHIQNDLGADSLEEAEIVMSVEEMHNLDEIPEDYAKKAERIDDICKYVFENCKEDFKSLIDFGNKEHFSDIFLDTVAGAFSLEKGDIASCKSIEDVIVKISA